MTDIEVIRELHCYKKMYNLMTKAVSGCADICSDLVVREKLIKAMQEAEDIYTGEIYEYKTLTADERIIVALLKLLMDRVKGIIRTVFSTGRFPFILR